MKDHLCMRKILSCLTILGLLFFSCETKQSDLLEITVDIDQNTPFHLSEITEELIAIELELSDASLINREGVGRIIIVENNVITTELDQILVFNTDGKFIRSIGSRGQGPGDYNYIKKLTIDEKNKHLYILSTGPSKIICYNLEGKFIKETLKCPGFPVDVNFVNNELLLVGSMWGRDEAKGIFINYTVYRLSEDFQAVESIHIRNTYLGDDLSAFGEVGNNDIILNANSSVYLYKSNNFIIRGQNPAKIAQADTLYRIEDNQFIPELKLKFKNDGIDGSGNKFINPNMIYRSTRFVFSSYTNTQNNGSYYFCYDTKTGKKYNMRDGYTDDINQIEKRVNVRPFVSNTEMFYYLYSHMKPDDMEEPNPTLYIGKLKK